MTLLLNGQAVKVLFGSTSVTCNFGSIAFSARAQLAEPALVVSFGEQPDLIAPFLRGQRHAAGIGDRMRQVHELEGEGPELQALAGREVVEFDVA